MERQWDECFEADGPHFTVWHHDPEVPTHHCKGQSFALVAGNAQPTRCWSLSWPCLLPVGVEAVVAWRRHRNMFLCQTQACLDDAVLCIGAFVFTPTSQHQCSHAVSKRPVGDQLERDSSRDRDSSTALQWRNISAFAIGAPAVLKHSLCCGMAALQG